MEALCHYCYSIINIPRWSYKYLLLQVLPFRSVTVEPVPFITVSQTLLNDDLLFLKKKTPGLPYLQVQCIGTKKVNHTRQEKPSLYSFCQ